MEPRILAAVMRAGLFAVFAILVAARGVRAETKKWVEAVYVEGSVTEKAPASDKWVELTKGMNVRAGASVRTGKESRARLRAPDGSMLLLQAGSTMRVEDVSYDDADATIGLRARLRLLAGSFWAEVVHLRSKPDVQVQAGGAIIGVRGTNFAVETTSADVADVTCSEGEVSVRRDGAPGVESETTTYVRAGYSATVKRAGTKLRQLTERERDRFLDAWDFFPEIRDRLKASFQAAGHALGGAASNVADAVTGEGESTGSSVRAAGRGVKEAAKSVGRGIAASARTLRDTLRTTPAAPSGTAAP